MSVLLFLENNNSQGSVQKPIWQRRRSRVLVSAAAIALLIVLAFEGISYFWPHPAEGNLVSFTCSPSSDNQTIIIYTRVNPTDGMGQEEAIEVANKVLLKISQFAPQLLYMKSNHDEKGMWTVEFIYIYTNPYGNRLYNDGLGSSINRKSLTVTINPFDQTVKYYGWHLLVEETLSAKDPNDLPDFKTKTLVNLVKLTMHDAYKDIVSAAETVRNSELDWTIVRLTMLNNN